MKIYNTSQIRNVAIVGGSKVGKTSLAEAIALNSNLISRLGSVDAGTSLSDYRDVEIEKKSSVTSSLLYAIENDKKINFIDVPGIKDFQGEIVSAFSAVDTALIVINAADLSGAGSEIAMMYSNDLSIPSILALNQLDVEGADFNTALSAIKEAFGKQVTVVQYPINQGPEFDSFIDLIMQKMYKYPKGGGKAIIEDIPESEKERAEELHQGLIENAATGDDALMEKFFDTNDLTIDEVRFGLRKGIAARQVFPLVCISAKNNIGVDRLVEFLSYNVPSPEEIVFARQYGDNSKVTYDATKDTILYVFKTANEPHVGEVTYMKVLEGEVTPAMDIIDSTNGSKERLSQIFVNVGKNREQVDKAYAGDIISTVKFKAVSLGDTLTTAKNTGMKIKPMKYPDPVYTIAIKAAEQSEDEKLGVALNDYTSHDPSIHFSISKEAKQNIISAMGEYQVNTLKWFLDNVYKIKVEFFAPKIPYRETITKEAESMYRHKKQSGGAGQFAEVSLYIQPYFDGMTPQTKYPIRNTQTEDLPWGGKLVFNNCIVGGAIDARFMPAILKGIMEKMEEGPLTGSYARDIVVNVFDGKMHPVDSNEMAFKLAGRNAFKDAFKNAGPKILEPVYDVEVIVPADVTGAVMTDLQSRRAIVMGMDSRGNRQIIKAKVPLKELNSYSTSLSSLSSGRGMFSMHYSEYQAVPTDVQNELLKEYEAQNKEEE